MQRVRKHIYKSVFFTVNLLAMGTVHCTSLNQEYIECMNNALATSVLESCIALELHKQDSRLQNVYKDLAYRLSVEQRTTLVEAQKLWGQFINVNCQLYTQQSGGELANLNTERCKLHATSERADELSNLLSNKKAE